MSTVNYRIFTDGGARGNPGPAATGVVVYDDNETEVTTWGTFLGNQTNNYAEYQAVIEALEWLIKQTDTISRVDFFLDSDLVVKQINGVYAVKHPNLKPLHQKLRSLLGEVKATTSFAHVRREANRRADQLVNQTLDTVDL